MNESSHNTRFILMQNALHLSFDQQIISFNTKVSIFTQKLRVLHVSVITCSVSKDFRIIVAVQCFVHPYTAKKFCSDALYNDY